VHESLGPLDIRELDFLAGIIARRIEKLSEFEDDERDPEVADAELELAP
jgi:hypothetical protein